MRVVYAILISINTCGMGKQYTTWDTGGPACDWFPTLYDEKGIRIIMDLDYVIHHFAAESKLIKRVWSCD